MAIAASPAFLSPTAALPGASSRAIAAAVAALSTFASPAAPGVTYSTPPAVSISVPAAARTGTRRCNPTPAFGISLPRRLRPREKSIPQAEAESRRRFLLEEAWDVFYERYVDEASIDWRRLRKRLNARPLETEEDLQRALQWLFSHADDPFTRFLSAPQLEAMKDDIDGEMCGVGIVFHAERHGWFNAKRVVIKHVVRNSPAADAGLMEGDRITAIDMASVRRMSFDEATRRLLGKEGKKVLISFRRTTSAGSEVELSVLLTRRRFEVPTVSGELLQAPGVGNVGYLQVREFAANTAADLRSAVRMMAGRRVALFILDMRGNSGGLVDKAVEVAKVFLDRDRIVVRFVGRDGTMTTERCGWRVFWRPRVHVTKEPMVILVDGETASASELVAAALRDNCRAVVVGNSTFGKGSVQAIVPLSDGTGVAVTVARYRTPKDKGIEMGRGLRPDLFKSIMAEDADGTVKELFGRGGARRYRWVVGRLGKCVAPECGKAESGRRRSKRTRVSAVVERRGWSRGAVLDSRSEEGK